MTADPRTVLVVSLGGLGDFLTRWPLWQSVRRSFPGARIVYLGAPRHARLLAAAGLCDEARDFDAADRRLPNRADTLVSALGARGAAWAERLARETGAARLVSIEPFPGEEARVPVGVHVERQISAAGLAAPGPPECRIPEPLRRRAAERLAERGLDGARTVAIHRGSGSPAKNWPRERFEALAAGAAGRGFEALFLDGEAEEGRFSETPGTARFRGLDLAEAASLLAACRAYVGNDSGVSHLAALLGVPTTVIFGPTDPAVWAPRRRRVTVLAGRAPCAPCGRERMQSCGNRRCLAAISTEKVLDALGRAGRAATSREPV